MKRLIAVVFVLFTLGGVLSAEGKGFESAKRGYFGTARVSYMMNNDNPRRPGIGAGVDIINGYAFGNWFRMGVGVGSIYTSLEGGDHIKALAYLQLRADVLDRRVTPFFALNIGGGFCKGYLPTYPNADHPGDGYSFYCFEPQAGVSVRLKNGKIIDFGVSAYADFGYGIDLYGKLGVGFTW